MVGDGIDAGRVGVSLELVGSSKIVSMKSDSSRTGAGSSGDAEEGQLCPSTTTERLLFGIVEFVDPVDWFRRCPRGEEVNDGSQDVDAEGSFLNRPVSVDFLTFCSIKAGGASKSGLGEFVELGSLIFDFDLLMVPTREVRLPPELDFGDLCFFSLTSLGFEVVDEVWDRKYIGPAGNIG